MNTQAYLAANPDVATSGVDPLTQYLQGGYVHGRPGITLQALSATQLAQIEAPYQYVLGRDATAAEQTSVQAALTARRSMVSIMDGLRDSLCHSAEMAADIATIYRQVLDRPPEARSVGLFQTEDGYGESLAAG